MHVPRHILLLEQKLMVRGRYGERERDLQVLASLIRHDGALAAFSS